MDAFTTHVESSMHASDQGWRMANGQLALVALLASAVLAIAIQCFWMPLDSDVSWLITVSERVLGGDRLYVDIIEVNPPASVWMYLPLVWLAHLVGIRPEAVVASAFILASILSMLITMRLASRLERPPPPLWLVPILGFAALVLPMGLFAQREHAALLLAIPALAALALIAEGKALSKRVLCAAGLAAGLVIVIKPPFALAIALPAIWATLKRKSVKPLLLPMAVGVAATLAYAFAVVTLTPDYLKLLPLIGQTYARMHEVMWKVVVGPSLFPFACLALAILLRPKHASPLAIAWGLGSAGFVLAAILQAKNYPNHWLPGTALAIAALAAVLAQASIPALRRSAVCAALAIFMGTAMYQWAIRPEPAVTAAILKVAPPHPTVIALSPELRTGHPVTRIIGGRWVGSSAGLFTAAAAQFVGLHDSDSQKAYRDDLSTFAADVKRNSPDIVLVDRDSKSWLLREPVIVRAMRPYRPAIAAKDTEVWVRKAGKR